MKLEVLLYHCLLDGGAYIPTSFFVVDKRIPEVIRELISEAEGCLKMNYLTGASACARKAVYELTVREKAKGKDYESKIKSLKGKFPAVDSELFDILSHIQDMTSEKVHEQSWDKWNSPNLKLILETLKAVLHEIYVLPDERKKRSIDVLTLREQIQSKGSQGKVKPGTLPRTTPRGETLMTKVEPEGPPKADLPVP